MLELSQVLSLFLLLPRHTQKNQHCLLVRCMQNLRVMYVQTRFTCKRLLYYNITRYGEVLYVIVWTLWQCLVCPELPMYTCTISNLKKNTSVERGICKYTLEKYLKNFLYLARKVESEYLQPWAGPLFQDTHKNMLILTSYTCSF